MNVYVALENSHGEITGTLGVWADLDQALAFAAEHEAAHDVAVPVFEHVIGQPDTGKLADR